MNAWLSKPISLEQLSRVLGQLCPQSSIIDPSLSASASTLIDIDHLPAKQRRLLISSMREDLQHLRQSLTNTDRNALLQQLHRMRGALAVIGEDELLAHFGKVQDILLQLGLERTQQPLHELCASVQTWLDHISAKQKAVGAN